MEKTFCVYRENNRDEFGGEFSDGRGKLLGEYGRDFVQKRRAVQNISCDERRHKHLDVWKCSRCPQAPAHLSRSGRVNKSRGAAKNRPCTTSDLVLATAAQGEVITPVFAAAPYSSVRLFENWESSHTSTSNRFFLWPPCK